MEIRKNRIKELRESMGISAKTLADSVGSSQPVISKLENGYKNKIDQSLFEKIADFFNVTMDYLLGRNENDIYIKQLFGWTGTLGSYIKKLRVDKKISIEELSIKSGVSREIINIIENDKHDGAIPLEMLKLMASSLGADYREFIVIAGHVTNLDKYTGEASIAYGSSQIEIKIRNQISLFDYEEGENGSLALKNNFVTFATHRSDDWYDELPPEAQAELRNYVDYLKSKYKKKDYSEN
ncbi:anaerobic benzoate catabolism transcriptional regulator [Ruminiclostridium hungatei]|uniref:Anaerobic benzoate catabolism transcriptional regulator n=1 Tax=Ruminiclostridium hungatei TaxID=48256 RepID=A0A1V4SR08_RUMHU|nr:helix-turn-helix transcriptional regulator [Ruminiclostridium hungatei]OPX46329.1 anaerobic benzoate catabolism transcriptional regulator [Ruminiclostridium hungatei]